MRLPAILLLLAMSLVAQPPTATDAPDYWITAGLQAFRSKQYSQAVEDFKKAVAIDPSNINAHAYLAKVYMTMYFPGVELPANQAYAEQVKAEFQSVLALNPNNKNALSSLADFSFKQALDSTNREDRQRKLDESRDWSLRLISVDPQAKEAYVAIAVIDWTKWSPPYKAARSRLNMSSEEPGPIPDPNVRRQLDREYGQTLSDAFANLDKALAIDPKYADAMAFVVLLTRQRADLRDTKAEYDRDIATADNWVQKALDIKKATAAATPQPIRVGSVHPATLLQKVDPVYPPLALQARVQGTVRFTANIAKDGQVLNLQLVSGHPLLVASAQEAVKQWIYRPTLLNGEPVEIVTQLDVNFTLPPQ